MYEQTPAQIIAERKLMKEGYRFSNWIPAEPDSNCQPVPGTETKGNMVMIRRPNKFTREYREIDPEGSLF